MSNSTWVGTTGTSDWSAHGDWSDGVPTGPQAAVFDANADYTVDVAQSETAETLLGDVALPVLDVTGTLALADGGTWAGTFDLAAGLLSVESGQLVLSGPSTLQAEIDGGGVVAVIVRRKT